MTIQRYFLIGIQGMPDWVNWALSAAVVANGLMSVMLLQLWIRSWFVK